MSSCEKRNVNQPASYKVFSETGACSGNSDDEVLDYIDTVELKENEQADDCLPLNEDELLGASAITSAQTSSSQQNGAEHDDKVGQEGSEHDKHADERAGSLQQENRDTPQEVDEAVNLHIAPEDDPFIEPVKANTKSPKKKPKSKLPKKGDMQLPKPTFPRKPTPPSQQSNLTDQLAIVEQERREAREFLLRSEKEAKIMENRLQAEEDRKRARQLQQKTKKNEKKVKQQRERYEKMYGKQKGVQHDLESWLNSPVGELDIDFLLMDDEHCEQPKPNYDLIPPKKKVEKQKYLDIASELIDDENVAICRDTGIYTRRESRSPGMRRTGSRGGSRASSTRSTTQRDHNKGDSDRGSRRRSPPRKDRTTYRQNRRNRYDKEQPWNIDRDRSTSPSRNRPRSGELEHSWFSEANSTDSDESRRKIERSRKKKSGINAKPCSKVKREMIYPHFSLGQTSTFIGAAVSFHNLTFEQFIAGEMCTIMNTSSSLERRGRITLLHKISQWKLLSGVLWNQIRNTYAMILRKIENCEIDWTESFDKYERHIYEKVSLKPTEKDKNKKNTDWFCKAFQRPEGCNKESPHLTKIGGIFRSVAHFCANCWLKDRVKRNHPEISVECPFKLEI